MSPCQSTVDSRRRASRTAGGGPHFSCPPSDGFDFFFFNDTATTEIYTLSLHDALPISHARGRRAAPARARRQARARRLAGAPDGGRVSVRLHGRARPVTSARRAEPRLRAREIGRAHV